MAKQQQTKQGAMGETALIEVPVKEFPSHGYYVNNHVHGKLTHDQSVALEKIRLGLMSRNERLSDGRIVQHSVDAVRWMLENTTAA